MELRQKGFRTPRPACTNPALDHGTPFGPDAALRTRRLHTLLVALVLLLPASEARAYPVEEGKYLALLERFANLAISHGRDTYGTEHSPVFVDGLSVNAPHEPVLYEISDKYQQDTGYPAQSYMVNAVSFAPFSRLLRELTKLTAKPLYEAEARAAAQYMLSHYTHQNGLAFWGEHSAWDCLNDTYTGHTGVTTGDQPLPMHEMKNPHLDYRFLHSVNPAVIEAYIQQLWTATFAGGYWNNLDSTRHLSFKTIKRLAFAADAASTVDQIVNGYSLPYETNRIKFYTVQVELMTSAFMYHYLTGEQKAWTAADALNGYHMRMRHSTTRLGPPRYAYYPAMQNQIESVTQLIGYGDNAGRYLSGVNMLLTLAELYMGSASEYFKSHAVEELLAWANYKHISGKSQYKYAVNLDGTSSNNTLAGYQHEGFAMFYNYAKAYRITNHPRFWSVARDIFRGYGLGDVGPEGGSNATLDFNGTYTIWEITADFHKRYDGFIIHGLLELFRASGQMQYLQMACKVADDIVDQLFANDLPQFVPNGLYSRLGELWPLALADIEAAIQGKQLEPDTVHPRNDMVLNMNHRYLRGTDGSSRIRDNAIYMQTGTIIPSNLDAGVGKPDSGNAGQAGDGRGTSGSDSDLSPASAGGDSGPPMTDHSVDEMSGCACMIGSPTRGNRSRLPFGLLMVVGVIGYLFLARWIWRKPPVSG